jgi:hypothetical protein
MPSIRRWWNCEKVWSELGHTLVADDRGQAGLALLGRSSHQREAPAGAVFRRRLLGSIHTIQGEQSQKQQRTVLGTWSYEDGRFHAIISTTPVARSYMAPTIWMAPFFSSSSKMGLRRRMFPIPRTTFVRATAST